MSILLFGAGVIAIVAGVAMIGFGIPINEFSFGNTLITAGTTAAVGGLIVVGLGAAVSHLQRIADALASKAPMRTSRPYSAAEAQPAARPAAVAPGRVPFPPRPKAEPRSDADFPPEPRDFAPREPQAEAPAGMAFRESAPDYFAPSLPNPDEPPVTVEDEVSLSPRHPMSPVVSAFDEPRRPPPGPVHHDRSVPDDARDDMPRGDISRSEPPRFDPPKFEPPKFEPPKFEPARSDAIRRTPPPPSAPGRPAQKAYFDSMWPTEPKSIESKSAAEPRSVEPKKAEPRVPERNSFEPIGFDPNGEDSRFDRDDRPAPASAEPVDEPATDEEPRTVAILKSGVVDGMGYTLYVDGSIEAELPQGTLRFASINELRSHLEQAS